MYLLDGAINRHQLEESKHEEKSKSAFTGPGESFLEKETIMILKKKNALIHCSWCIYLILSTRQS